MRHFPHNHSGMGSLGLIDGGVFTLPMALLFGTGLSVAAGSYFLTKEQKDKFEAEWLDKSFFNARLRQIQRAFQDVNADLSSCAGSYNSAEFKRFRRDWKLFDEFYADAGDRFWGDPTPGEVTQAKEAAQTVGCWMRKAYDLVMAKCPDASTRKDPKTKKTGYALRIDLTEYPEEAVQTACKPSGAPIDVNIGSREELMQREAAAQEQLLKLAEKQKQIDEVDPARKPFDWNTTAKWAGGIAIGGLVLWGATLGYRVYKGN